MKRLFAALSLLCCLTAFANEVIPPAPTDYFSDYAGVTSPSISARLNDTLREFERQTSSQIWVVVYPVMQTDSSIDDYTVRIARAWKTGLKGKDNGAILFVFIKEHKLFIQTGYGLEGALPDILCKRIIDEQIVPRFKQGDFDGGLTAGVISIIAATKHEYHGTGQTVADSRGISDRATIRTIGWLVLIVVFIIFSLFRRGGGLGGAGWWLAGNALGGWSSGGGSSSGSGGGGWGGGGGAMGGGGSFGGGGAGGSW